MAVLQILVPALYGAAIAILLVYALNLYWLSVRYVKTQRLLPGRPPEATAPPAASWPRVTVQLPVYNEALVVRRLIEACARLDYPSSRLEIQVLDDSTDLTSELIAEQVDALRSHHVDIVHVRRHSRDGFKAGALANGLRFASGDFVAIFDADFVPPPDFLLRTLPTFADPGIGLVQARWGHLNERQSRLTRIQAFGLDTHFAVEQQVRGASDCFINFNGTAGVWRRTCIEEAGGWRSETLTEDLDLSYRAQLAGWRFEFVNDLEVPAELPALTNAYRSQQARWAKGSMQTAVLLLPCVWRSVVPVRAKIEGSLHLTAHLVFPLVLLAGLLHVPLVLMKEYGVGPGEEYFLLLGLGMFGLAGFFLAQVYAQRSLYPDWQKRLNLFPWFMAGTMGLSISNTRAVCQALAGRRSSFVRTPKQGAAHSRSHPGGSAYSEVRIPAIAWWEFLAASYCFAGLVAVIAAGQWAAAPFQALLVWGFGLISWYTLRDRLQARPLGRPWPV